MGYKDLTNINQEIIKQQFLYNPATGLFTRIKKSNTTPANYIIPKNSKNDYSYFRLNLGKSTKVPAHLLAWIYMYNRYPIYKIIHINSDKSDNKISNLKELSQYDYAIYMHNLSEKSTYYKKTDNNRLVSKLNNNISYEELIESFTYKDGNLIRIKSRNSANVRLLNKIAGTKSKADGYIYIRITTDKIKYKRYLAHRLIWLYHNKSWPNNLIDHINGIRDDNRIENLREATSQQNSMNKVARNDSTTGIKGVFYSKSKNVFWSSIMVNERRLYLGSFKSIKDAEDVYNRACSIHFGEFSS